VQIAYVDQSHDGLDPEKSVFEVISGGTEMMMLAGRQVNSRAYIGKFNFTGQDQSKKLKELSGGERNRVHLAMTLKQGANVLLLDEPTNDIDVNTLRALEEAIENFAGCAVIISHDRWFLDRVCTHMLAFEGNGEFYFFDGNYSEYEENLKKRKGDNAIRKNKYRDLSGRA
jgi:ATPase subunit of ABC transporter with duplicated ATPase domains